MNSERLNRISFFYFMSVITAGLLTVAVLFSRAQVQQWQSRQELLVYSENELGNLVDAELKVFLAKSPYAAVKETLTPSHPLTKVLDEKAAVVILQRPLTDGERESLTAAGIKIKESQVGIPGSSLYIITSESPSRSGRKLAAFLQSEAGKDIAGRRLQPVKAGKPS